MHDVILKSPDRYRATTTLHVSSGNSLIINMAFFYMCIPFMEAYTENIFKEILVS